MDDGFAEFAALKASGRWWEAAWLRDPKYLADLHLRPEQVEASIGALRACFDENWAKAETFATHPIIQELFGSSGLVPFNFLYDLGDSLRLLTEHALLGDLARRLKVADEFDGAWAELAALAQWVAAGVQVERNVRSGSGNKNCDWKASAGDSVIFGEVKRIWSARKNSERSDLGEHILGNVLELMGAAGICGEFRMQLLLRPETLPEVWELKRAAASIARKIMAHLEKNRESVITDWQVIEGVARYQYIPGVEPEGLHGDFGGIPHNLSEEGDKIMDVVEEAAGQLPSSGPGIVMISGGGGGGGLPFGQETGVRILERFDMAQESLGHVSGVLVVKTYLIPEHGLARLATYVPNPRGKELDMALLKRGFPTLTIWEKPSPHAS